MIRLVRAAAPNVGYGMTVMAALFLGEIGLLLATLPNPATAAEGRLTQVLAFAIVGSLALIFTGLNLNRRYPLADRSAILWIWLLSLPVTRRLAEIALSVRWGQGLIVEAALMSAAVVLVLMSAGVAVREEAP
jgi:hypothetical protein